MQLLEEALTAIGISEDLVCGKVKITVYSGVCACLENVMSVLKLESEEVDVQARDGIVRVYGKNLRVARYDRGDLWLKGAVCRVEIGEEQP